MPRGRGASALLTTRVRYFPERIPKNSRLTSRHVIIAITLESQEMAISVTWPREVSDPNLTAALISAIRSRGANDSES